MKTLPFEEFKAEILSRAKAVNACESQYKRAIKAGNIEDLLTVIKDNFSYCVREKIIDIELLSQVDSESLESAEIYLNKSSDKGYILADSGNITASGSAIVRAYNSVVVRALDSAEVWANDSAKVRAYNSVVVRAYNSAEVLAYGRVVVRASDNVEVRAFDSAVVSATGSVEASAWGNAVITRI